MKSKYTLLLIVLVAIYFTGMAAAANETSMADIVDMDKVKESAAGFWETTNKTGNIGYLVLGICAVVWLIAVIGMLFIGGGTKAIGKISKDGNETSSGDRMVRNAAMAAIIVPILIILVMVFAGLI